MSSYPGLKYHLIDAYKEVKIRLPYYKLDNPPIALFSKKYYNTIAEIPKIKKYDYCFIGSINSNPEARTWVLRFAYKYFTTNSIFINTDLPSDWITLGDFDLTNNEEYRSLVYNPKIQKDNTSREVQYIDIDKNKFYFETLCKSRISLCPAGDMPWSMRFYESLICGALPMVEKIEHTYRTKKESRITYQYILNTDLKICKIDSRIDINTYLFKQYHLLNSIDKQS